MTARRRNFISRRLSSTRLSQQQSGTGFGSCKSSGFVRPALPLFFKNYANFRGRSSRGAYWWYVLISVLIGFGLGLIDGLVFTDLFLSTGGFGILGGVYSLATLIPGIALSFRAFTTWTKPPGRPPCPKGPQCAKFHRLCSL